MKMRNLILLGLLSTIFLACMPSEPSTQTDWDVNKLVARLIEFRSDSLRDLRAQIQFHKSIMQEIDVTEDSVLWYKNLLNMSNQYLNIGILDSSRYYFEQIRQASPSYQFLPKSIQAECYFLDASLNYLQRYDLEKAIELSEKSRSFKDEVKFTPHMHAMFISFEVNMLMETGKLEAALHKLGELDQYLDQLNFVETSQFRLSLNIIKSKLYIKLGDVAKAEEMVLEGLKNSENFGDWGRLYSLMAYQNLASIQGMKGFFSNVEAYVQKADSLCILLNLEESYFQGQIAGVLGNHYLAMGDYRRATNKMQRSIDLLERHLDGAHFLLANELNNLGHIYQELGKFENAEFYHRASLRMRQSLYEDPNADLAYSYFNLGEALMSQEEYDSAEYFLKKSLHTDLALQVSSEDLSYDFNVLAKLYVKKGAVQTAESMLRQALNLDMPLYSYSPQRAHTYQIQSELLADKQKIPAALQASRLAFSYATGTELTPDPFDKGKPKRSYNPVQMVDIWADQLNLWLQIYQQNKDISILNHAHWMVDQALGLGDSLRAIYASTESKLIQSARLSEIYEYAAEICWIKYQLFPAQSVVDAFFSYAERNKSRLIQEGIQNRDLLSQMGDSDLVQALVKEQELMSFCATMIQQLEPISGMEPYVQLFELKLDSALDRSQQLELKIKDTQPELFFLKRPSKPIDLEELQTEILSDNVNLVEYLCGNEALYIALIHRDSQYLFKIPVRGEALDQKVAAYRKALEDSGRSLDQYGDAAYELYTILLEPLKPYVKGNKLWLVLDGPLHYLPFDALLEKKLTEAQLAAGDYADLPYVIKSYECQRLHSVQVLKDIRAQQAQKPPGRIAAFLPATTEMSRNCAFSSLEAEFNIFDTLAAERTVYKGPKATQEAFHQLGGELSILHLGTHGIAEDQHPGQSRLFFADPNTERECALQPMYAYEFYHHMPAADLVILSACQTGLGEWKKGEGVLSLAHAVSYSARPSLIMSLWQIRDVLSAELLSWFYGAILSGKTKSAALRLAKLEYLKVNYQGSMPHPRHWAGLVMIGDPAPIKVKMKPKWKFW